MITYFPTPYPDESFYSLFARYAVGSGVGTMGDCNNNLYGRNRRTDFLYIGDILPEVQTVLTRNKDWETMLKEHTIYNYTSSFLLEPQKTYPGNYEKRKQLRLEKEKPVLEAFWSWLDQQKPVRNTRLDKAVNYVLNRRDIAETYLEDGRCSFTNNLSENAIRPFAVGRKNWLFSSSVDGANASAVVYTMVEMAKAHGLNIYGYLKFLLENRPSKNMTDEQLAELAPWSEKLQSIKNRM